MFMYYAAAAAVSSNNIHRSHVLALYDYGLCATNKVSLYIAAHMMSVVKLLASMHTHTHTCIHV